MFRFYSTISRSISGHRLLNGRTSDIKNRITALLIIALFTNVNSSALVREFLPAFLREVQQTTEVEQLKQAIEKLEAAEKDVALPADVKELNRRYLQQKRSELETKLNNGIAAWHKYLDIAGDGLDEDQKREVQAKISALEGDLKKLKSSGPAVANQIAPEHRPEVEKPKPAAREVKGPEAMPAGSEKDSSSTTPKPQPSMAAAPSSMAPSGNHADLIDCSVELQHPELASLYEKYVCQVVRDIKFHKTGGTELGVTIASDPTAKLTSAHDFQIALALIGMRDKPTYLVAAEEERTDKQIGAGPQANGTTSLVVKGSAPTFLGIAVENGALAQSISGSTITFRGNPVGILQALANKGYLQSFEQSENNTFLRILKPFSFSFSFDTSRGNEQTNTSPGSVPSPMQNVFTADRQQLSQVTARYEFLSR